MEENFPVGGEFSVVGIHRGGGTLCGGQTLRGGIFRKTGWNPPGGNLHGRNHPHISTFRFEPFHYRNLRQSNAAL